MSRKPEDLVYLEGADGELYCIPVSKMKEFSERQKHIKETMRNGEILEDEFEKMGDIYAE